MITLKELQQYADFKQIKIYIDAEASDILTYSQNTLAFGIELKNHVYYWFKCYSSEDYIKGKDVDLMFDYRYNMENGATQKAVMKGINAIIKIREELNNAPAPESTTKKSTMKNTDFTIIEIRTKNVLVEDAFGSVFPVSKEQDEEGVYILNGQLKKQYIKEFTTTIHERPEMEYPVHKVNELKNTYIQRVKYDFDEWHLVAFDGGCWQEARFLSFTKKEALSELMKQL